MKDESLSIQDAFDKAGKMYQIEIENFLESKGKLFEEFSEKICLKITDFFERILSGYVEWHVISKRFSSSEQSIKESQHIVKLIENIEIIQIKSR